MYPLPYLVKCIIFIPISCFLHKMESMEQYGKEGITIIQEGEDFEECQ
jgi:hypothetical protein